jgi:hypothetical protein
MSGADFGRKGRGDPKSSKLLAKVCYFCKQCITLGQEHVPMAIEPTKRREKSH